MSQIKEICLDYIGYASFWKHYFHGNKNYIYFYTNSGKKFEYEIVLENKQMKEELKTFLNILKNHNNIHVQEAGSYSF